MTDRLTWKAIENAIRTSEGVEFRIGKTRSVGGGCINAAYQIDGNTKNYFVKVSSADRADMFEAEADGLREICATQVVKVPRPVTTGATQTSSFFVLEWLDLGYSKSAADAQLGEQLAKMHRLRQAYFGWHRDNTIGSSPQPNARCDDWCEFFAVRRLGFQFELAKSRGNVTGLHEPGCRLLERLGQFFAGYDPYPSLLHGDLWSGNASVEITGKPVIFDPACYYGDREADLAMTELFGGFGGRFYQAYSATIGLDPGYKVRKMLYNLYHILNHLNLFGSSYLGQAQSMIEQLLAELG